MSVLLTSNLALLAQGYDDIGAASRSSIIIGILAFPCLIIIAVVWQKLKNAKESDKHIEALRKRVVELEKINTLKQSDSISPPLQKEAKHDYQESSLPIEATKSGAAKSNSNPALTKEQQAYIDEVFARAGKPSVALQQEIDEIRRTKTEDELTKLFLRGSEVVRPTIEAELLCAVMLAKKAELSAKN